jgi:hypothetical protein
VLEALGVLGLTVAFHELGHFTAARVQGIHVTKFAIGFGPTLFKYQASTLPLPVPPQQTSLAPCSCLPDGVARPPAASALGRLVVWPTARLCAAPAAVAGTPIPARLPPPATQGKEVEYSLRALPLGGYVAFPDDDPESKYPKGATPACARVPARPQRGRHIAGRPRQHAGAETLPHGLPCNLPCAVRSSPSSSRLPPSPGPVDDPDLLSNRSVAERVVVVTAGVIANVILAFTICTVQARAPPSTGACALRHALAFHCAMACRRPLPNVGTLSPLPCCC